MLGTRLAALRVRWHACLHRVTRIPPQRSGSSLGGGVAQWSKQCGAPALALLPLLLVSRRSDDDGSGSRAAGAPMRCAEGGAVDWEALRRDLVAAFEDGFEHPGPMLVRLAWHSSGTYCRHSKTGGSNGAAMRHSGEGDWEANAGLWRAMDLLEEVKENHPEVSSYADLWVFAAGVAIEEMGGPRIAFTAGRRDKNAADVLDWTTEHAPDGRLPSADMDTVENTAKHIRSVFDRMGFDDQEIVALCGAHTLGRCHANNSGYHGPWTYSPAMFSSEYFRNLLEKEWTQKTTFYGKPWTGNPQYEDATRELMMLPSDIALLRDPAFRKWVELYAADEPRFFSDFARAFAKLMNLGVVATHDEDRPTEAQMGTVHLEHIVT
mmetsp:Transcript_95187/g.272857  ORF Transcript_95187/g.272857 Transcript_95187/m.272857 type:complete len:378 (+) Transcript_95187:44-1177(+)